MSTLAGNSDPIAKSTGWSPNKKHVALAAVIGLTLFAVISVASRGELPSKMQIGLSLALVVATWFDVLAYRIPNRLNYSLLLVALAVNAMTGIVVYLGGHTLASDVGLIGWQASLLGAVAGFGMMLMAFLLAGSGAGDVKLIAASGAVVGPVVVFQLVVVSHFVAALFAIAWLLCQVGPFQLLRWLVRTGGHLALPRLVAPAARLDDVVLSQSVPMAGFFALGYFLVQ